MTNNIDFLPARYGEQHVKRRMRIWLLTIVGIFASGIAITSSVQLALQKQVESQLAAIEFQYSSAQATRSMFDRLQARLVAMQATAGLYAYLENSWPSTQILLAVSRPLTEEITLSELTIAAEAEESFGLPARSPRARRRPTAETVQPAGVPAKLDVDALKEQMRDKRTVLRLAGITNSDIALHRYVSQLNNNELFAKAELLSVTSSTNRALRWSEFLIRVIVRREDDFEIKNHTAMDAPETRLVARGL